MELVGYQGHHEEALLAAWFGRGRMKDIILRRHRRGCMIPLEREGQRDRRAHRQQYRCVNQATGETSELIEKSCMQDPTEAAVGVGSGVEGDVLQRFLAAACTTL